MPETPSTRIVTVRISSAVGERNVLLVMRCGPSASPPRSNDARFRVTPPPTRTLSVTRYARERPEQPVPQAHRAELAVLEQEVLARAASRAVVAQLEELVADASGVALEPQVLGVREGRDEAARERHDDTREIDGRGSRVAIHVRRLDPGIGRRQGTGGRGARRHEAQGLVRALAGDRELQRGDEPEPGGVRERGRRVVGDGRERAPHGERLAPGVREVEADLREERRIGLGAG